MAGARGSERCVPAAPGMREVTEELPRRGRGTSGRRLEDAARGDRRRRILPVEALQPLGGVGKARPPFADAKAGEQNRREEDKELELRPRVTHRGQPATELRAVLECQLGYAVVYPLRFTREQMAQGFIASDAKQTAPRTRVRPGPSVEARQC